MKNKLSYHTLFNDFTSFLSEHTIILVPSVLVVIGWIIVHKLSSSRERQAGLRKSCLDLVQDLEKLERMAIAYHTSYRRDKKLEFQLKQLIQRLGLKIEILTVKTGKKYSIEKVRKSITLNNFETTHFIKQAIDSDIVADIQYEIEQLIKVFYFHGL